MREVIALSDVFTELLRGLRDPHDTEEHSSQL